MSDWLPFLLFVAGVVWLLRRPRKKVYYGQTFDDRPSPSEHFDESKSDKPPMTRAARIGTILFLGLWLTVWTFGCYMALTTAAELNYGEEGYIFLRVWLAAAIPAWIFVAWTLFRLLRGDEIDVESDGGD